MPVPRMEVIHFKFSFQITAPSGSSGWWPSTASWIPGSTSPWMLSYSVLWFCHSVHAGKVSHNLLLFINLQPFPFPGQLCQHSGRTPASSSQGQEFKSTHCRWHQKGGSGWKTMPFCDAFLLPRPDYYINQAIILQKYPFAFTKKEWLNLLQNFFSESFQLIAKNWAWIFIP